MEAVNKRLTCSQNTAIGLENSPGPMGMNFGISERQSLIIISGKKGYLLNYGLGLNKA